MVGAVSLLDLSNNCTTAYDWVKKCLFKIITMVHSEPNFHYHGWYNFTKVVRQYRKKCVSEDLLKPLRFAIFSIQFVDKDSFLQVK